MNANKLFHQFKSAKTILSLLLAGVAAVLTGCIVTSVYPFYAERDLTYDPALVGHWTKEQEPSEHWKFEAQGTNAYRLTYETSNQTNLMQAHLFTLRGQLFLDLFPEDVNVDMMPPPIPSHLLLRVEQLSPTLRMAPLDHAWLLNALETNPKSVRHELLRAGTKPEDIRVVLTAETAGLQDFLINHLQTEDAWKNDFELKRD